jgi:chaperonin GroEL (HSP60 family)
MASTGHGVWKPVAQNVEFDALESNCNAVLAVAETVRTTLGPKGLDKLLIDQAMNRHVTNDGVTILLSLKTIHPVARMIVEIAERQEEMVGDGTTTAVVMAAEMIKEGKKFVKEMGVHPSKIVEGIDSGVKFACKLLEQEAKKIGINDVELEQVVKTSLASKLDGQKLAPLVISAIRSVGENAVYDGKYDFVKAISVVRKENMQDSLVNGIVLERKRMDKEMPGEIKNARIMICKLDLKPIKESWITDSSKYEDITNMETDKLKKSKEIVNEILSTGANVLLIASPEVDQFIENLLISKKVLAIRVAEEEIDQLVRYTGAKPIRMMDDLKQPNMLGTADHIFENEDQGLTYIENGSGKNVTTIIVSGATRETSLERWRAAKDGVNAAEAALNHGVVAGGGAAELHLVRKVKDLRLKGLESVGLDVVMVALESIMRQILTNAGFNGLEKVMEVKASPEGYGIDVDSGEPINMWEKGIIDPLLVKTTALEAAGEISKSVLRIDKNLAAEELNAQAVYESKR